MLKFIIFYKCAGISDSCTLGIPNENIRSLDQIHNLIIDKADEHAEQTGRSREERDNMEILSVTQVVY